jgi:hypothetical protein
MNKRIVNASVAEPWSRKESYHFSEAGPQRNAAPALKSPVPNLMYDIGGLSATPYTVLYNRFLLFSFNFMSIKIRIKNCSNPFTNLELL